MSQRPVLRDDFEYVRLVGGRRDIRIHFWLGLSVGTWLTKLDKATSCLPQRREYLCELLFYSH
jgi:hypothetical protein